MRRFRLFLPFVALGLGLLVSADATGEAQPDLLIRAIRLAPAEPEPGEGGPDRGDDRQCG
jgi:hypothetical protein